jgi:hypothetical protein
MNIIEQHRAVAYYREAFHDMPVGGPMDGAAYGEYLKSKGLGLVIGVVASVATMGAGFAVMGATLASQLAGGAMIAGGAMSGLGAVTGNKKLSKIGGVLSLAGGIGAAAVGMSSTVANSLGQGSSALADVGSAFRSSWSGLFGEAAGAATGATGEAGGSLIEAAGMGTEGVSQVGGAIPDTVVEQTALQEAGAGSSAGSAGAGASTTTPTISTPQVAAGPAADGGTLALGAESGADWNAATSPFVEQPSAGANVSNTVSGGSAPSSPAEIASSGGTGDVSINQATRMGQVANADKTASAMKVSDAMAGGNTESGGILETAWKGTKDFFGSKLGQETAVGLLKGAAQGYATKDLDAAKARYYDANTSSEEFKLALAKSQMENMKNVPIALNPTDPGYAEKKRLAEAAGQRTFDIAQVAAQPVTRNPVQNQFTSSPATAR